MTSVYQELPEALSGVKGLCKRQVPVEPHAESQGDFGGASGDRDDVTFGYLDIIAML